MLNQSLLEALYEMGATAVMTATDARKVEYTMTFEGQGESLRLTLPPGHYVFCRVADAPGDLAGLGGVSKPKGKSKLCSPIGEGMKSEMKRRRP